jgi:hypothetical protein
LTLEVKPKNFSSSLRLEKYLCVRIDIREAPAL